MIITAFLFGLLGSFHCVGMCGPIAFLLPVDRSNSWRKFTQIFLYHFSRILAYSALGLVFGIIGKSFNLFGWQQQISIIAGILLILLVAVPHRTLAKYNLSKPLYKIIAKVKTALGIQLKKKTGKTFFSIGFLNGFLPCGMVYMAVFGAMASGSISKGALYMTAFGLGTIPLMTAAIYLGNFLSAKTRQYFRKAVPVFVILIGCLFILRGLGLGIPYISPKPVNDPTQIEMHRHH